MQVEEKTSTHDLVTWHDQATEEQLSALLTGAVPDSRITGEEGGARGEGAVEWIVDPIDGTSNFTHGFALFTVSIAAAVEGQVVAGVVHDPVQEMTFSADDDGARLLTPRGEQDLGAAAQQVRTGAQLNLVTSYPSAEALETEGAAALESFGTAVTTFSTVRRLVSGALELCHAAAGWADVVLGVDTKPWDVAAGMLILRRAGGQYLPHGVRDDGPGSPGMWRGAWQGEEGESDHLAPHYLALAPGVDSPEAHRLIEEISARRAP